MKFLLARKLGMTQIFQEDGTVDRVTVLQAGPCRVSSVKTPSHDGYSAVQVAFSETKARRLTKAELGHLKANNISPHRLLKEFRTNETDHFSVGSELTVDIFEAGDTVSISGISKGKGFQGTVRRHGFARGPVSHGSRNVRAPGSIGASATPSRVMKGLRAAGRMGGKRITLKGLKIVATDTQDHLLLVKGSVPGPVNGIVEVVSHG